MHGPPLVGWLLVALTGATGLYCLLRMRGACRRDRGAAGGEALMGLGMAAMAVPAAAVDVRPFGPVLFTTVFTAVALRSLLLLARGPGHSAHHVHHAVGGAAMVYMALAMAAGTAGGHGGGHTGPGPAGIPALTGALLVYFAVFALRTGARLVPGTARQVAGAAAPAAPGRSCTPELGAACRVSMGIGMFAMLLTM